MEEVSAILRRTEGFVTSRQILEQVFEVSPQRMQDLGLADGPRTRVVHLRVTDTEGSSGTDLGASRVNEVARSVEFIACSTPYSAAWNARSR